MGLLDLYSSMTPDDQGLLGIASGLLSASGPSRLPVSTGQALGAGMQSGLHNYQQGVSLDQLKQLRSIQAQLGQANLDETRRRLSDMNAAREVLRNAYRNGMPQSGNAPTQAAPIQESTTPDAALSQGAQVGDVGPTITNAERISQQPIATVAPKAAVWTNYQRLGDSLAAAGLPDQAQQYYALAEKFRPRFKADSRTVKLPDGRIATVNVSDDGSEVVSGYAPAEKLVQMDLGGATGFADPYSGQKVNGTFVKKTMTPDAAATNNIANRRLSLEFGLTPEGKQGIDTVANAIATGQLPPPSGMALTNPRNQQILRRVMEINPNYDFTDVTAKRKAASDFASGPLGQQMRSFATAGQHLDQLGNLVDSLKNNDLNGINRVANWYKTETGKPGPTNFEAAKDVISKEVMKAIVAGGGGQAEREELSKSINSARSPDQLNGVIKTYRDLMSAQYENLLEQRRAAGLSDATLPKYTAGQSSQPDLAAAAQAELQRRGLK